jgi:O-antigen/teichoic acid export membrane protein
VATIAIFLTGVSFLVGEELIIGLFGAKWRPSIPIFQILILKGFTYPISAMIVNAFLAKGMSRENFRYGNIRKILRLIPFAVAYFYGFYPFLYASVGIALFTWVLNNYFVAISLKVSFKKQFLIVFPQLFFTAFMIFLINWITPNEFSYFVAIINALIYTGLYFVFLRLLKSPIFNELSQIKDNLLLKFKSDSK